MCGCRVTVSVSCPWCAVGMSVVCDCGILTCFLSINNDKF